MLFTRCTLTNWPKTSNRTSDIERPPARQGIRTFPVIGYLSPRLLWTWARWWGCCRCCCYWRRRWRCNKKHPRVVKFYVWLCVALRYPVAARPRPLLTIELVIGREMATGNANGMVWDGPGMCSNSNICCLSEFPFQLPFSVPGKRSDCRYLLTYALRE